MTPETVVVLVVLLPGILSPPDHENFREQFATLEACETAGKKLVQAAQRRETTFVCLEGVVPWARGYRGH